MKAELQSGDMVELGPEHIKSLHRAARLLRLGAFRRLILEQPVPRAGWFADHPIGGYATLFAAGLVDRRETVVYDAENEYGGFDITYTVTANVEFTDADGNEWKQGDVDEWLK